jgi:hypothetical protein
MEPRMTKKTKKTKKAKKAKLSKEMRRGLGKLAGKHGVEATTALVTEYLGGLDGETRAEDEDDRGAAAAATYPPLPQAYLPPDAPQ